MGYIYKNATFTIAAEAASSSTTNILDPSRLRIAYPIKVSCHDNKLRGSMIIYRARYDTKGPLSARAWALQEDVLSTRVLRWTRKQLTWHCRTVTCSEHDPTGAFNLNPKGYSSLETLYQKSNLKFLCLSKSSLQKRLQEVVTQVPGTIPGHGLAPLSLWRSISQNFASRSLTYNLDRLPAISGVAKEVARHTGHTYKAWLWEEEIHAELLWWVEGKVENPREYIAPSWSWAGYVTGREKGKSTTIHPRNQRSESRIEAEILRVDVVPEGKDLYGRVVGGELVLRGPCLQTPSLDELEKRFDCMLDGASRLAEGAVVCVQILCFSTKQWFSPLRCQYHDGEINALILVPVMEGQYRRVGIARIPKEVPGDGWESRTVTVI